MAVDYFIAFDHTGAAAGQAVPGETQDSYFKSPPGFPSPAFEIEDWNFGSSNKTTLGSATGGGGGGKAEFDEFTITKNVDSASPNFFLNCVTGTHYNKVSLYCRKSGGSGDLSGKPYLTYTFATVFTTSVKWKHGDEGPKEDITFKYGSLVINYQPQDATGSLTNAPAKTSGWSVLTNKKFP